MAKKQTKNIYKRKDGRWEGRYYTLEDGKKKSHSVYGKSKKEVEQVLAEKEMYSKLVSKQLTIREIAEIYLADKKERVKRTSYERYIHVIHNIIIPFLGNYKPVEVDYNVMKKFSAELDKNYTRNVKKDIITIANSIIRYPERINDLLGKYELKELNILTGEELDKLVSYLEIADFDINIIIRMILYTGMKIGEFCALRWEMFDLKKNEICINQTLQRLKQNPDEKTSKTELVILPIEERRIPIHPKLRKYIAHKSGYVLTNTDVPTEPRAIQYRLKTICKHAEISEITFSDLRDNFAVIAMNSGMSKTVLAQILGINADELKKYDEYVFFEEDAQEEMKKVCF